MPRKQLSDNPRCIEITLDRTRHLFIDANALSRFRRLTGEIPTNALRSLIQIQDAAHNRIFVDPYFLTTFMYVALRREDPRLTEDDVGDMITGYCCDVEDGYQQGEYQLAMVVLEAFYAGGVIRRPPIEGIVTADPQQPATGTGRPQPVLQ